MIEIRSLNFENKIFPTISHVAWNLSNFNHNLQTSKIYFTAKNNHYWIKHQGISSQALTCNTRSSFFVLSKCKFVNFTFLLLVGMNVKRDRLVALLLDDKVCELIHDCGVFLYLDTVTFIRVFVWFNSVPKSNSYTLTESMLVLLAVFRVIWV